MNKRKRSDRATFMLGSKCCRGVSINNFHCSLSPLQPMFKSLFAQCHLNPPTTASPSNNSKAQQTIQTQTPISDEHFLGQLYFPSQTAHCIKFRPI